MSTKLMSEENVICFLEMLFPDQKYWQSFLNSNLEGLTEEYDTISYYTTHDDLLRDCDELVAFAVKYSKGSMSQDGIESILEEFRWNLEVDGEFEFNAGVAVILNALAGDGLHCHPIQEADITQFKLFTEIEGAAMIAAYQAKKALSNVEKIGALLTEMKAKLGCKEYEEYASEGEAV